MSDQPLRKRPPIRALVLYNYIPRDDEDEDEDDDEELIEGEADGDATADAQAEADGDATAEAAPEAEADSAQAPEPEPLVASSPDEETTAPYRLVDASDEADEDEDDDEYDEDDDEYDEDDDEYDEDDEEEFDPILAGLSRTEAEVYDVARALMEEGGFVINSVNIEDEIARLEAAIVVTQPTFVFNMVDELEGDDTQHPLVASYLDLHGVNYTGSQTVTLALCQDRSRTRPLLASAGVPVPGYTVVRAADSIPGLSNLRFPVVLSQAFDDSYAKDCLEAPIDDVDELRARIAELVADGYELPYLVEEVVPGRRIHAVVLGNGAKLDFLPLTESDPHSENAHNVDIAELSDEATAMVRGIARQAFQVMGCRDWAQIDLCLDETGNAWVTGVNPVVDMADTGPFCTAAGATEPGYDGCIVAVAGIALERMGIPLPPKPKVNRGVASPLPEALMDVDRDAETIAESAEALEAEAAEAREEEAEAAEAAATAMPEPNGEDFEPDKPETD